MKRPLARAAALATAFVLVAAGRCFAPPPLVTGDVPTAGKGRFEWYIGYRHQDTGAVAHRVPHSELVYGLGERWELSLEMPCLAREGEIGFGDVTLATKVVLLPENDARPGIGASYEFKLDNGDAERGLGSGGYEHEFRLRAQMTWGWFTPIMNVGYVIVPDVEIGGVASGRRNVLRASFAQEWQVARGTKLLSEIYWRQSDEPGGAYRLGWSAGFKHRLRDNLAFHAAVGESLRAHDEGGPELRVYAGFKWEFAAPWTRRE